MTTQIEGMQTPSLPSDCSLGRNERASAARGKLDAESILEDLGES